MCKYSVIIKTGEAEIRAIENSEKSILNQMFPLIEITRGRKVKDDIDPYPFYKRLDILKKSFAGQTVALDLTSDDALSSTKIEELYNYTNGYQNWIDFLFQIKNENVFKEITPTILLNRDDKNYNENLLLQVQKLKQNFTSLLYRNSILDEDCYYDFELLKNEFRGIIMYIMIDCEYTPQASQNNFAEKVIARINNIKEKILTDIEIKFIVTATSFPNNVTDLGDNESDTFSLSEIQIHNAVCNKIPNVIYGDYGSINPKRNDTITMARGWIPRIDVALPNSIYYYKKRRPQGISAYAATYTQVAQSAVKDSRFPKDMKDNWGIQQINTCAKGGAPSSTPRFWIAVRMNIHIAQQVKRLY
ncbi:MAG: beta family protein [Candidatus Azobacteroides sp.]|nr:beta family protein [Candidatus Azobacteroides sp.]